MTAEAASDMTVQVLARPKWNFTGIQLVASQTYRFGATGCWVDWYIKHGPDGDPSHSLYMRMWEGFRRVPTANWFTLIGALNCDLRTAFIIGAGCTKTMPTSGELTCFANDVSFFYWNNRGAIEMVVARES